MASMVRPDSAIRVTTYSELSRWLAAFASGSLNFIILLGTAGLQKSRMMRDAIGTATCWIEGHATPLAVYMQLYRHRDELVVIDDVDALYSDRTAVRLLKTLCQTEDRKRVAWLSNSRVLEHQSIPHEFITRSRVAIIANEWSTLNQNVTAVEDRAHVLVFEPNAFEVHQRVAEWFWDQEVFDFIAKHLHLIPCPSMRYYALAAAQKDAGLAWRPAFLQRCGLTDTRLLVAKFMADDRFPTVAERVAAFVKASGCCQATYYNHACQLAPPTDVPKIQLSNEKPNLKPDSIIDLLRRRHGQLGSG